MNFDHLSDLPEGDDDAFKDEDDEDEEWKPNPTKNAFRIWVGTFQKDECEDKWGLLI